MQGPEGNVENRGRSPRFSTFPRDLLNVNEWKIMFDPSILAEARIERMSGPVVIKLFSCKLSLA